MPELGEVAHAVSLLRRFIGNKTITAVKTSVDEIVFSKPLTNFEFENNVLNTKVTSVGRQGKYFWFECNKKSTVLLHFGMTGWLHVKGIKTHFIAMESGGDKKQKENIAKLIAEGKDPAAISIIEHKNPEWPPKWFKFVLVTDDGHEVAFVDSRRLARIRVFDCNAEEMQTRNPIAKLGIDYSQAVESEVYVKKEVLKRKMPIKALLLDQTVFSGIGNWLGDEILYHARIFPGQYSNTLSDEEISALYSNLIEVCRIAAETEANTSLFPKNWLMLHRWGKARKNSEQKTADGHVLKHITVGGRTACYAPSIQKPKPRASRAQPKKELSEDAEDGNDSSNSTVTELDGSILETIEKPSKRIKTEATRSRHVAASQESSEGADTEVTSKIESEVEGQVAQITEDGPSVKKRRTAQRRRGN